MLNHREKISKDDLLKAVQKHLEKVANKDFDGTLFVSFKKGYISKVRDIVEIYYIHYTGFQITLFILFI